MEGTVGIVTYFQRRWFVLREGYGFEDRWKLVWMELVLLEMVARWRQNCQKMAMGGVTFGGLRGLQYWPKMAKTLGGRSSATSLPWWLACVVLQWCDHGETKMEASACETRKKEKEKRERERRKPSMRWERGKRGGCLLLATQNYRPII